MINPHPHRALDLQLEAYRKHLITTYKKLEDALNEAKELKKQVSDFKVCIGSIIGLANRKMKDV